MFRLKKQSNYSHQTFILENYRKPKSRDKVNVTSPVDLYSDFSYSHCCVGNIIGIEVSLKNFRVGDKCFMVGESCNGVDNCQRQIPIF